MELRLSPTIYEVDPLKFKEVRALQSIFSTSSYVTRNQPVRPEPMISHEIIA